MASVCFTWRNNEARGETMLRSGLAVLSLMAGLAAWAPAASADVPASQPRGCDPSLGSAFEGDPQTRIVLTRQFRRGERLLLEGDTSAQAPLLSNDLCLVKLVVGPGNPGPQGAPSTSQGIGIEIWLPSAERWNGRIHALGGGGFQGGASGQPNHVGAPMSAMVADSEGAVSSTTDAGHSSEPKNYGIPDSGGDFLMLPDGSANEALWRDFAVRSIHEQAVKTKTLTAAYYGRPASRAYFDGSSTGGRQGHKLAQAHPGDYDGIIANLPAMHWTRLLAAMAWPHLVFQRDLGGRPLAKDQLDLVSNAAIAACDTVGGQHIGFILDPARCRYDPTRDRTVLCSADGGSNTTPACVTGVQARAINKIWFGPTSDGSVPDPARDNGWKSPPRGKHIWYGPSRGTSLWNAWFESFLGRPTGVASPEQAPFLGTHWLALAGGDPALADADFRNAKTNGRDGWKALSYAQFAATVVSARGLNATTYSGIDTDDADLSGFEAAGGKLLFWHGTNDEVIPVQGSIQYYDSVVRRMGGLKRVQRFYRFYIVPGAGHQSPNGTANPAANPPAFSRSGLYQALVDWVENGVAPERIELVSPSDQPVRRRMPVCPYPQRAHYISGDPNASENFICHKGAK